MMLLIFCTFDVSNIMTKNFFTYGIIEPIKTMDLISPVEERPTPQSFTFTVIDISARSALREGKDMESFCNGLFIGDH